MRASAKSQDDNDKNGIYSGLLYSNCTSTIRGFRDFLETSSSLGFTFVKKTSFLFLRDYIIRFDSSVTLTRVAVEKHN